MRKILTIVLLSFLTLFGAEDNKTQEESIISLTNQILTLNNQIQIIKAQQKDTNSSKTDNSNLASLQKKKNDLLEKIPLYIMQIEVTQSDIDKFRKKSSEARKTIK